MVQVTFLFLDLENIQPDDLSALAGTSYKIRVFLGSHQTKVPVGLARTLQAFGADAEYIQMDGVGRNALDFHIAYYLGRAAVEHPKARFLIVSKDTGFDPLVAHLRARKLLCERLTSAHDLRPAFAQATKANLDRIDAVIADLVKRQNARPRTLKTLTTTIDALFQKQLGNEDVAAILAQLEERGLVKVSEGKLSYNLPIASLPATL